MKQPAVTAILRSLQNSFFKTAAVRRQEAFIMGIVAFQG